MRGDLLMKAVYGLYSDADGAQRAVDTLRSEGIPGRDIVVISSEPFEEYEFGRRDHRTPMPWLAALGGLLGGGSGYLLSSLAQRAYPIPTGGMPLVAHWTDGIVTYELTMLGAILMTLLTLLITAHLPDWSPGLYDAAVSDGCILIGVVNPPEKSRVEIERRLREAGTTRIKEVTLRRRFGSKLQGATG
jgi:hypothetical protein